MRLRTLVLVAEIGRRRYELPVSVPEGTAPERYDVRIDPAGRTSAGHELVVPVVVDRLEGLDVLSGPIVAIEEHA